MRLPGSLPALVIGVGRSAAWIAFDGETRARVAEIRKRRERLSLVPGDRIEATPLDEDRAVVDRLLPRAFALERRTGGGRTKTMAANVDTLAIVAAFERPPLHPAMVDELIAFAELHALRPVLILTKPDLVDARRIAEVRGVYEPLGYDPIVVNPKEGTRVSDTIGSLNGRHTLLIGQSGVGKSSLFRAMGGTSIVGDLSRIGRGRQTTTSARLLRLPSGFLIDSPGISEFELHNMSVSEIAHGFVEIRARAGDCKFTDCTHRVEPHCAVKAAVDGGAIARSRYESYVGIVERESGA